MESRLQTAVERLIEEKTGRTARITASTASGGGCINDARTIRLEDGRSYFLKSNPSPLPGMFCREAEGLEALANVGAIRVPRPIGTGGEEDAVPFIVMEYISTESPKKGFQESFGRQFAELHLRSKQARCGFDEDNYLGSTPQPNGWRESWVDFWRENRLGYQLELARKNGHADPDFRRRGDILLDRLDDLIGEPDERACLLHGDLWGGNYLADSEGAPVLIDPAAYFGRREADLAMTHLFGGFSGGFYGAYEEIWPLAEGAAARLEIYKLYHLLNHLNLFGGSYYSGCISILRRFT